MCVRVFIKKMHLNYVTYGLCCLTKMKINAVTCVVCVVWYGAGETPYTVSLFTFDDLVDCVRPGDRLEVTGIFRALPRRLNSHMTTMRSIYKTYVDAVHFKCVVFLLLS